MSGLGDGNSEICPKCRKAVGSLERHRRRKRCGLKRLLPEMRVKRV